jgi:hypothetical protein
LQKKLCGVCHGLEYGETKPVMPVAGGVPVAKFYSNQLHHRLPSRVAYNAVLALGGLESVARFHKEICGCNECLKIIRNDPRQDFLAYLESQSKSVFRSGRRVSQEFPTAAAADHCTRHYIAAALIEQRIASKITGDPFSIISLNWDSLIEDSIYWVINKVGALRKGKALVDVDYCVHTTPLPKAAHTASTKQKACGIFNVKLLKMHGSSTWLRCPCSNLVYTGLGMNKPAHEIYVRRRVSPFIKRHLDEREKPSPSILEPFIITPTFTKVFDLPHIQTTWHNAFVELREADQVVFIGYSSVSSIGYTFRAKKGPH